MEKIKFVIQNTLIFFIKTYQYLVSPFIGHHCRFYPTCSNYAEQAIKKHGIISGFYLAIKRLCCCHPWHSGGVDPVPEKIKN